MDVKDGIKTTELKVAVGSIVSVLILVMVVTGAISQSEADTLAPVFSNAMAALIVSVPAVIGWIATVYTNARRDVKTSANAAAK